MNKTIDLELVRGMKKITKILVKTKNECIEVSEKEGYDLAYFNVDIDLKFTIDTLTSNIKQKWKRIEE